MADKEEETVPFQCVICRTFCTSYLTLCEHVVGKKHQANVVRFCPRSLPHMFKLQYFFDTYMEQAPLVGLEFMEETQRRSGYKYRCLLCDFRGVRISAFKHITGADHINKYILKHHPELSVHAAVYPLKAEYLKAVQEAATTVCKINGKKKIQETTGRDDSPIKKKIAKYDSQKKKAKYDSDVELGVVHDRNGELQVKPRYLESKKDQGGFSGNRDFLDYLKKFKIRDDEDARIMKQITRNCTQALVQYWHDQAHLNEPPGKASETQSDATQLFFDSIKNMEESEVVDTLHKIAATNPAFRGIAVPNVIKYLRETGRLKTA